MKFLFIIIYIFLTAGGLILFKVGATNSNMLLINQGLINIKISFLSIAGLLCYMCSFILYLGLISKYNLSYIVPITTGIMQIIMLIAATVIFKETVTLINVIGVIIVLIGIFFINL
jgi:drug/metabolite transporter (DMT)-like permease